MDTLQTIIHRPVILGSTWYAYLREESVPWGVAQHDLLVGQLPSSLLFAESIVCDEKAFRQEMLARDVMKWASSEVLGLLEQEGIVQPRDFRADVKAIFENPVVREQAELLLSPALGDAPLLRRNRDLDNLLTDGLAAPAGDSTQEAMNVGSLGSSPLPSEQRASWATAARVLLPVFLEEDFYILPPRSIWPAAVKQAVKDIAKLQAPHLDRLARLEYTGAEYLYAIWEAH